jgi:hypothetical protein
MLRTSPPALLTALALTTLAYAVEAPEVELIGREGEGD